VGLHNERILKANDGCICLSCLIFFARTLDRLGKGIRTSARDALLSDESTPETKGKVFGFHRGMDTLGAAIWAFSCTNFSIFSPWSIQMVIYYCIPSRNNCN